MSEILKIALPAVLALMGAVIGIALTHRRWKREVHNAKILEYQKQRKTAYTEFWKKLENVHVKMRTELLDTNDFSEALRDINSFVLLNSIYLDVEDHRVTQEYIKALQVLQERVLDSRDGESSQALFDTSEIPPAKQEAIQGASNAWQEVERIRSALVAKVKQQLQA